MENYLKNKFKLIAAHSLFLVIAGSFIIFRTASYKYLTEIQSNIFITAYSDSSEDLEKLYSTIKKLPGVKNVDLMTDDEVIGKVAGSLARKDILNLMPDIKVPAVYKIYLKEPEFGKMKKIAAQLTKLTGIKYVDEGGKPVKILFMFISKFKTVMHLIALLLIINIIISGFAARGTVAEISERFTFLRERCFPIKKIWLVCATEIILVPLISFILAILFLLAIWQSYGEGLIDFLARGELLILFILSFIPGLSKLLKK